MRMPVTRRAVLRGLALAGAPAFFSPAYAGFRVVRTVPGEPGQPQIVLPGGYSSLPGPRYQVASRAEFTSFVQGPVNAAGIRVLVRWPGQQIQAVVAGERRLPAAHVAGDAGTAVFDLPVVRATPVADSPTVQVWSTLSGADTGILWLVAHNDPDRAAGTWAAGAWPAGEAQAVLSYTAACDAILRDSGLAARARRRGHCFALEGFETNNMLHQDNPPHWHLSYYPGPSPSAAPATVPHFWVDGRGRTFYNGQDVTGRGRSRFQADQAAPMFDGTGGLVLTTVIRADGGLEVVPAGGPVYRITSATGDYTGPVTVLRGGAPWRSVATVDRVRDGILRIHVQGEGGDPARERTEYVYDPLTGPVLRRRPF